MVNLENKLLLFGVDCAEHILPYWESKFPLDKRPRKLIDMTRKYLKGTVTANELENLIVECEKAKTKPKISIWIRLTCFDFSERITVVNGTFYTICAVLSVARACIAKDITQSSFSHFCTEAAWHNYCEYEEFQWQKSHLSKVLTKDQYKIMRNKFPIENLRYGAL